MKKTRLTIGIRKGIYDSERHMFSVPVCFDSEQSAQTALDSMSEQLKGLEDVDLTVASQTMVSVRPETYESYDEAGSFPRLYEAKKEQFNQYVIRIDVPDITAIKDSAERIVNQHNLQIIDEGAPTERSLIFLW